MSADCTRAFHCWNETPSRQKRSRDLRRVARATRCRAEYVQDARVHSGHRRKAMAGFLKALLSDGALKGWYKELVAVRISTPDEVGVRDQRAQSIRAEKRRERRADCGRCRISRRARTARKKNLGFRLADRLHRGPQEVDDAFYAELKESMHDTELVELFLTAAAFEMFPRFIDGLHIPVTPLPASK